MHYFASLLVRYKNAVVSHSLEFAAQNAMRYRLSATLLWRLLAKSGNMHLLLMAQSREEDDDDDIVDIE